MGTEKENLEGFVKRLLGATRQNHGNYVGSLDHRFDIKRAGLTAQDVDAIVHDVKKYGDMPELHKHKFDPNGTIDRAQFNENLRTAIAVLNKHRPSLPGAEFAPGVVPKPPVASVADTNKAASQNPEFEQTVQTGRPKNLVTDAIDVAAQTALIASQYPDTSMLRQEYEVQDPVQVDIGHFIDKLQSPNATIRQLATEGLIEIAGVEAFKNARNEPGDYKLAQERRALVVAALEPGFVTGGNAETLQSISTVMKGITGRPLGTPEALLSMGALKRQAMYRRFKFDNELETVPARIADRTGGLGQTTSTAENPHYSDTKFITEFMPSEMRFRNTQASGDSELPTRIDENWGAAAKQAAARTPKTAMGAVLGAVRGIRAVAKAALNL